MSETSAPWRALEDPVAATDGARDGAGRTVGVAARPIVSWWVAAALGLAAVLIGVAGVLVVSGGQGSALTLKRGATGKPFCTLAFIASGEVIQAIASKANSTRSSARLVGMQSRKPPIGLFEAPPGPFGCCR